VAAHQLARIHKATTELVAEHGYQALKVRDIVGLAEVSTRAFYEHFSSKEDCFLQTYNLISRRATRRIISAQAGEPDWRKRLPLVLEEFIRELENGPAGAQLALVEAYAAGEKPLEQAWRAERIFEGMLCEAFARAPRGAVIPPMIIEGMVAGVAGVSRGCLPAGSVSELRASRDELVEWALCYPDRAAVKLAALDRQSVWRDTTLEPVGPSAEGGAWPSTGDRALIVAAVAELAATSGYAALTAPRIRAAAGVSRRKFSAHFDDVEDCYLGALEQRTGRALAQASRAQAAASSWLGGVYRAIAALCEHVSGDAFLARVCLADEFPPGPNGARSRQRLGLAVVELLGDGNPRAGRTGPLGSRATTAAIWSLFHRHVIRDWALRRRISATLSYLALAPAVGAEATVAAILAEQSPL
jgi:AcrR family transcriptional regulator